MTNGFKFVALAAVTSFALTSCVDDNYDLSDLDKTMQFQVRDLVVPVNLDEIELQNILHPAENSTIKEIDGQYVVMESGKISSDEISIDRQLITPAPIKPTVRDIAQIDDPIADASERIEAYDLTDITGDFDYEKTDIPEEIQSLRHVDVDWTMTIKVEISDPQKLFKSMVYTDVVLTLPKGLDTENPDYDPETGLLNVGRITPPVGATTFSLDLDVTGIDFSKQGADEFTFTPGVDGGKGTIKFTGSVGVASGHALITMDLAPNLHPATVTMTMTPVMGDMLIKAFSGKVKYTFSNFNVPSVSIHDLPDLLADEETDIILSNPQLYLSVNNPMAGYGLDTKADINLVPVRNGVDSDPLKLNPGEFIVIGTDRGTTGPYRFCVSPERPDSYYEGYDDASQVYATDFSYLLSGEGMPKTIKVKVPTAAATGEVNDFQLGVNMGKVDGDYTFYCPLALSTGSKIVYSDTIDGWNSETVDRIVITSLTLMTDIDNELPFDVTLSGYPLTAGGEQAVDPETGKPVFIKPVTVPANSVTPITTTTDGIVTRLDGIHFVATANVVTDDQVLETTTGIKLQKIRVKVSGTYTDTF